MKDTSGKQTSTLSSCSIGKGMVFRMLKYIKANRTCQYFGIGKLSILYGMAGPGNDDKHSCTIAYARTPETSIYRTSKGGRGMV